MHILNAYQEMTFHDTTGEIEVSFRTHGTGTGTGWTDRRGSRNSYLDAHCDKVNNDTKVQLSQQGSKIKEVLPFMPLADC